MEIAELFQRLGVALGLGLLVGLQREQAQSRIGGLRTFPLITVFGILCGFLAQGAGGWVIAAGVAAIAVIALIANLPAHPANGGMTTEVSLLVMFGVGAYLATGAIPVAVAIGGGTAVLLHFKATMHKLADRLDERELTALMRFALLALVILPALPDETYGPYGVFNPRKIWLLVVLIVGISLAGYIVYKFFGEQAGMLLGGVLGGLISSTATTVSFAKRAAQAPGATAASAIVIAIASTVVYARVLVEIAAVAPGMVLAAAWPVGIQMGVLGALALGLWFWSKRAAEKMPEQENPAELKSAFAFGALFAFVLFVSAAVRDRFGTSGLYVVAGISGLTDVDAITLSTAQLVADGRLEAAEAWRIITVAVISNLAFKVGTVGLLGTRRLLMIVGTIFAITAAAGAALIFLWPDYSWG
jgi:uncharacterized membrane protein (DUF4010 family)